MRKLTSLICSFIIVTTLQAQWQTIGGDIINTNPGYVGIGLGSSTPRSPLELLNTARVYFSWARNSATGECELMQINAAMAT